MSDVDIVMALDLERKITNRIREEFVRCAHGLEKLEASELGPFTEDGLISVNDVHRNLVDDLSHSVLARVRAELFTNPSVLTELKLRMKDLDTENTRWEK